MEDYKEDQDRQSQEQRKDYMEDYKEDQDRLKGVIEERLLGKL